MDNLPRLMGGEVPGHERRARALQQLLKVAGGLAVVLLVLAAVLGGSAGEVLAGLGWALLTALPLFGVVNLSLNRHWLQPYPDLGDRTQLWRAAGASREQLRLLNEAHRLDRLNPPVGYGDRRTLINPLADAYAIFTSPAWRDPWLADRQLLIDPVVEAAEIIAYVHRVTGMLKEVRGKLRTTAPGSAAHRTYRGYEQALLASLDDGLKRARALTAYRAEVHRLEVLLRNQLALPEAEAFADRVLDVLSESARQEMATRQIDDSREQLAMLEAGLREITDLLSSPSTFPKLVE